MPLRRAVCPGRGWLVYAEYGDLYRRGVVEIRKSPDFGVADATIREEGWYYPDLETGSRRVRCTFPIEGEVFVRVDRLSDKMVDDKMYYSIYVRAKKPLGEVGDWEELVSLAEQGYICTIGACMCEEAG